MNFIFNGNQVNLDRFLPFWTVLLNNSFILSPVDSIAEFSENYHAKLDPNEESVKITEVL